MPEGRERGEGELTGTREGWKAISTVEGELITRTGREGRDI